MNKKQLLVAAVVLLAVASALAYWFMNAGQLSKDQKAENKQIEDTMKASYITGGLDRTRLADIEASRRAGKYAEALRDVNAILAEPGIADADKRTLYAIKGPLCIEVKDLSCADEFIAEFNKLVPFDYYFLVDAARLAKASGQSEKAKEYYRQDLTEIDKQGGQAFVDKLNESAEVTLDYAEIKNGAGN